jgi:2,3-bisphosphoglycerate-dependent phosphoglycerate mutase
MAVSKTYDLVIIRHGQSEANKENIFTGWRDSPLSPLGVDEARAGGRAMREASLRFDIAFTSLQSRAIKTLWLALEELDQMWLPEVKHWRLNERHYGALQGKNKIEAVEEFGEQQVHLWRRGYDTRPPEVDISSSDYPKNDPRYSGLAEADLPRGESLKDVVARVMPYWHGQIVPHLEAGRKVLISAHGNSLRALVKHLEGVSDKAIEKVNLPTGIPKGYKLNKQLLAASAEFLGDPEEVAARAQAVANQAKRP